MHEKPSGPQNLFSQRLHAEKYRLPGETFRDQCARLAASLHDDEEHRRRLMTIALRMEYAYAGRIQAAVGSPRVVTPFNCFVSGTIADSMVDGDGSIYHRLHQSAATMRMGGGIGYDWSTLRPGGDLIRGVMSRTDGPLAFMPVFDATCKATSSHGNRRGAQMGTMRVDHPDILRFVTAKHEPGFLEGFNLSVAVTDEFMQAVENDEPFDLRFNGQTYSTVRATMLWEQIMRSAWDYAEPGVIFIDTINRMNNLWYCEEIATTNPCGEQPLPPFGACLLGSFNLTAFVRDGGTAEASFDWERLNEIIPDVVRSTDNVIDQAIYPLPEQEEEALMKRRMGLGITGLANTVEALGMPYGSEACKIFTRMVLQIIRDGSYRASVQLAKEKGAFPLFDDRYLEGEFIKTLPQDIQDGIREHGIRNSHLTSIAPTGTMSFYMDNVSSGVEPVFCYESVRDVIMDEGKIEVELNDFGYERWGVKGKLANEVTAKEHIEMLVIATQCVDSAVSKTCNVDGSMEWEAFKDLYMSAWKGGCKGCTVFNKDGKRMGILREAMKKKDDPQEESACFIDFETGKRECS